MGGGWDGQDGPEQPAPAPTCASILLNIKHKRPHLLLVSGQCENVVGLAHIQRLPGKGQEHVGHLDFYIHDNFIDQAAHLVKTTLQESAHLHVTRVNAYCLACDKIKRDAIEACGGVQIALLAENAFVAGSYQNVLIHQFKLAQ